MSSWVLTCPSNADEWSLFNQRGISWRHRYPAAYSAALESVINNNHIVTLGFHDWKALARVSDTFEMIVSYLNPDILVRGREFHDTKALSAYRLVDESVSSKDHTSLKVGVWELSQNLKRHVPGYILIAVNEGIVLKEHLDLWLIWTGGLIESERYLSIWVTWPDEVDKFQISYWHILWKRKQEYSGQPNAIILACEENIV